MLQTDINCDMGEGVGNDAALMPYITSANIACGYHAGDEGTIRQTIILAKKYGVKIGAHPSFLDRENYGRKEMTISTEEVYQLVMDQLFIVKNIALEQGTVLHHIKPHGALYNMAANDFRLAKAIGTAVKDFDGNLVLYGLSGSCLITEAKAIGLKTRSEVFSDRTYQDDGSLTPRTQSNALIVDEQKALEQVLSMVQKGFMTTVSGKQIPIVAETVCIHSDGKQAVQIAKKLHEALQR